MPSERPADVLCVHLQQGCVVRAGARDQDVVDRAGEVVEESLQRLRVVGVEGSGAARIDLTACPLELLGIPRDEDHFGALAAGAPGGLEADAGTAADQHDRLTEQFRQPASFSSPSVGLTPIGPGAAATRERSSFSAAT